MARILLISANTTQEPMPVYPLGMALVDTALRSHGHQTRQFDLLYDNEKKRQGLHTVLAEFKPEIVGISVRNIDSVDSMAKGTPWYLPGIRELVADIRSTCQAPVVLGGPAVSIMPETILDYSGADHCVVGEGEVAFNILANKILSNDAPPKIIGPLSTGIGEKEFLSPNYSPDIVQYYIDQSGILNYQTKRGCPFGCIYCSYPLVEGKKFRFQEPEFVVENLKRLKTDFDVDSIFFTDSIFNDPGGRYLEIAEHLTRANIGVRWAAYFRPDKISPKDLDLLKQSGLYAMEVGSDAACDTTLEGIGKTYRFNRVREFNEACLRAEIPCAHFFMFGGPGETHDTVKKGLQNIQSLRHTVVSVFSGIRILPGTGIAALAVEQGVITPENSLMTPVFYVSPGVDKIWMDSKIKQSFAKRKDRFFPPEEGVIRMKALKAFGFKGLLWDMILRIPSEERRLSGKAAHRRIPVHEQF